MWRKIRTATCMCRKWKETLKRFLSYQAHLNIFYHCSKSRTLVGLHTDDVHCMIKVLNIFGIQLEERCKFFHEISNLRCCLPEKYNIYHIKRLVVVVLCDNLPHFFPSQFWYCKSSPIFHTKFKLWQKKIIVELVNWLDVREHLWNDVIGEHVMGTVLKQHAEMKYLSKIKYNTWKGNKKVIQMNPLYLCSSNVNFMNPIESVFTIKPLPNTNRPYISLKIYKSLW